MSRVRAYKMLSRVGEKFVSWNWTATDIGTVAYKVGEKAVPQPGCGPLSAFEDLWAANQFWDGWRSPITDSYPTYLAPCLAEIDPQAANYRAVWIVYGEDHRVFGGTPPRGTLLCKSIELTDTPLLIPAIRPTLRRGKDPWEETNDVAD